ncbi:MAG: 30S ribosomal protein S20, partial [Mycobacterium sp.]|nr:30S ribosomal protein S20 [Mycobacterium sp.]
MANIKSQKKRILTNERRRMRNKSVKSSLHTAIRAFRTAAADGDKDKAGELLVST